MHPIHDQDPLFLLATAIAAKRRPAQPAAIIAAIDFLQSTLPGSERLAEIAERLARAGLLDVTESGIGLTAAAEALIEALPLKADHDRRQFELRNALTSYRETDSPVETPDGAVWHAALLEHRAASKTTAKNLLMPKPATDATKARPGQRQRKPLSKAPSRKR